MKKSIMRRQNWIITIASVFTTYLGYALIAPITTNYDGLYAFFAIFVLVLGIIGMILGLAIRFPSPEDVEE